MVSVPVYHVVVCKPEHMYYIRQNAADLFNHHRDDVYEPLGPHRFRVGDVLYKLVPDYEHTELTGIAVEKAYIYHCNPSAKVRDYLTLCFRGRPVDIVELQ